MSYSVTPYESAALSRRQQAAIQRQLAEQATRALTIVDAVGRAEDGITELLGRTAVKTTMTLLATGQLRQIAAISGATSEEPRRLEQIRSRTSRSNPSHPRWISRADPNTWSEGGTPCRMTSRNVTVTDVFSVLREFSRS